LIFVSNDHPSIGEVESDLSDARAAVGGLTRFGANVQSEVI
jgi:hypothetical protein